MKWDDLTPEQKKYWIASCNCSDDCRERYLCRCPEIPEGDVFSCPAFEDPDYRESKDRTLVNQ